MLIALHRDWLNALSIAFLLAACVQRIPETEPVPGGPGAAAQLDPCRGGGRFAAVQVPAG